MQSTWCRLNSSFFFPSHPITFTSFTRLLTFIKRILKCTHCIFTRCCCRMLPMVWRSMEWTFFIAWSLCLFWWNIWRHLRDENIVFFSSYIFFFIRSVVQTGFSPNNLEPVKSLFDIDNLSFFLSFDSSPQISLCFLVMQQTLSRLMTLQWVARCRWKFRLKFPAESERARRGKSSKILMLDSGLVHAIEVVHVSLTFCAWGFPSLEHRIALN